LMVCTSFFLLSLVKILLIKTISAISTPASNHTTHFHNIHLTISLVCHINAFQKLSHKILYWHPHLSYMSNSSQNKRLHFPNNTKVTCINQESPGLCKLPT
jgi:hypothetical protein